jgi:hypothetical protein
MVPSCPEILQSVGFGCDIDIDFYALIHSLLQERLQGLPFPLYDPVAAVAAHFSDDGGNGYPRPKPSALNEKLHQEFFVR